MPSMRRVRSLSAAAEAPDNAESERLEMGRQIRGLRRANGLTLEQLASACGRSPGFLSKVERGIARPSITALQDIAEALGVPVGWFFTTETESTPDERPYIVRAGDRKTLHYSGLGGTGYLGFEDSLLSASLDGRLALGLSTYRPGGATGDDLYTHDGEEAGLILSGRMDLHLDGKVYRLNAGDSYSFPSTLPHRYVNPGPGDARLIWANTPISLRLSGVAPAEMPG